MENKVIALLTAIFRGKLSSTFPGQTNGPARAS
jgi:hypothetical protein